MNVLRGGSPLGLVLSGGGARGAFQVGVWEVLQNDPRGMDGLPHVISGTSAGALNGALIAAGLTPAQMLEFWLGLADSPPVKANEKFFGSLERAVAKVAATEPLRGWKARTRAARLLGGVVRRHLVPKPGAWLAATVEYWLTARFDAVSTILDSVKTAHIFSTAPLRKRLISVLGGTTIRKPTTRLAINTVDVRTGGVIRFVNVPPQKRAAADTKHYKVGPITVDMILASASIPLLFDPVRVGGHQLWDGGLLVNTPLAPTVALGAERIIPVLVSAGEDTEPHRSLSLGGAVERLADAFLENAYNMDRKLLVERNRVAEATGDEDLTIVSLFEAIRPESSRLFDAGSYLYFERRALTNMYEAGRRAARRWLREGPLYDVDGTS